MKLFKLLFPLVIMLVFNFGISAKELPPALKNGFSINATLGIPMVNYGRESSFRDQFTNSEWDDIKDLTNPGTLFGIQLGNRWYLNPQKHYAYGLMVNWIDISSTIKTAPDRLYDQSATVDLTILEFGPIGTFALTKNIAIDGYYNLRPTAFGKIDRNEIQGDDEFDYVTVGNIGFGLTHAVGASFRWTIFSVGLEYIMGTIKTEGFYDGPYDLGKQDLDLVTNSLRINLGVKF